MFLLVRPLSGTEWRDETIRRAVESVYSVLDASFHRAIVNTAYRQEAKHQLELTYFAFGHELKNRIDALRMGELSNKVHASAPKLIPDVDRCRDRLRTLRGMAGVFSIVAKSQDGVLPPTWVSASKIPAPPDVPTEKQCEELKAALSSAVAAFWYLEDAEELLVPVSYTHLELMMSGIAAGAILSGLIYGAVLLLERRLGPWYWER